MAADTYGYLGFWHHTNEQSAVTHTRTTAENATAEQATQQWQNFCRDMNFRLPENQNGCFGETFLHNQCAAAAFDAKRGLLKPNNLFIAVGDTLAQVQDAAQQKCVQAGDEDHACEVETAFCSNSDLYQEWRFRQPEMKSIHQTNFYMKI